jgi:hypothetical protein
MSYFHNTSSLEQRRVADDQKVNICKENGKEISLNFLMRIGITLVQIPFWWNRKLDSLSSTLYSRRPELFTEIPIASPIPLIQPSPLKKPKSQSKFIQRNISHFLIRRN